MSTMYDGLHSISLGNRPFGNLVYEQEIDQVFLWMESWNIDQINESIVHFVKGSSLSIKRTLKTTLEPLLHRDYIYHKFGTGKENTFSPISTYFTREMYEKLEKDVNRFLKRKHKEVYRLKSAQLKTEVDVKNWCNASILPNIKSNKNNELSAVKTKNQTNFKELTKKLKTFKSYVKINQNADVEKEVRTQDKLLADSYDSLREKNMKAKSINTRYIFQNPCHASTLQRSKTQLVLPSTNHTNHTMVQHKAFPSQDSNVFQKFPLRLKATRRHLQAGLLNKDKSGDLKRIPTSTTSVTRKKMSDVENHLDQVLKICAWLFSWNEWQEEYFMRMFLKLLSTTQLYFTYAIVMVSKCWRSLCLHDILWKPICERKDIVCGDSAFFNSYSLSQKININWRDGRYAMSDIITQNASITTLDVWEDLLATASTDKWIKIWRLSLGKCILILEGHQKVVWGLQFVSSSLLLSCSNDQTIKMWNLRSGSCLRTIHGHDGAVWCLRIQGEYFISGSSDRTAKVWSLRSCSLVRSFNNHPGGVYSVEVSHDLKRFFTGTVDKTIRVWDLQVTECIATLQVGTVFGPLAPVTSLSYDKGFLWCACNNDFQIWDVNSLEAITIYTDAHKKIECGQMKIWKSNDDADSKSLKGRIVTCGKDGKTKIWTLASSKATHTINLPEETIPFLLFDDRKILLSCHGAREATVKMVNLAWNV